ncbi:MAG: TetR/AcrR family transcriptional regulator [Anaerolineae bacterium]|nr:TetR/AcrR family transcriptional regulator [Anaerolineae bacterium]
MTPEEIFSKGERTRAVILDAAYDLFLNQGYSATSMRQIAERAGLAVGSIYNHFAGKDEIFQALIIDKHPYLQILPVLQETPGKTTEEFIRNASRLVQEKMGHHPDFIKLMFIEIVEFEGRHFPKVLETIFPLAYPLIERFTVPGSGVRQDMSTPKLIRAFIGSIMAFYLTDFLVGDASVPPGIRDMRLDDFMEIFMYGILEGRSQNSE